MPETPTSDSDGQQDHISNSAANIRPEGGSPNNGGADVRTPDTAATERAYEVAERAKRMIADLFAKNRALTEEMQAIKTRPLPPMDDPGYQVWRALMEDLRDEGLARLTVRTQTVMEVTYEPA